MPANLTEFRDNNGVDVADKWVSVSDVDIIYSYLSLGGHDFYNNIIPGSFWIMGNNTYGQLALNETTTPGVSSPIQVGSLNDWKQVSLMNYVQGAVKTDGTLWMWGSNSFGVIGLGDRTDRSSPVQVGSLTNWKQVSVSDNYACAIKTDGTLWAWGYNDAGQLGLGDRNHRSSPVQVGSLTNWKQVETDSNSMYAIKTDGTLWAWGWNYYGQLGQGNLTHRSSPVQVGSLTNWKTVFAQYNSNICAIKTDGTLWAWGKNSDGQLGLGDVAHRSSPTQVGSLTDWKTAAPGYSSTLAVKTNGTLWAMGNASNGRLGLNNTTIHYSSPVQVGTLTNWKTVENNPFGTPLALKTDGTLWGWGSNNYGQMGLSISTSSPVQIGSLNTWKQIIGGGYVNGAIK